MKEPGTLLIFKLSVESSYIANKEIAADKSHDTIQWWISESVSWRIKTFSIDCDIHCWRIGSEKDLDELFDLAVANTVKTYGDVLEESYTVNVSGSDSEDDIRSKFLDVGINPDFEWDTAGYLFWRPNGNDYSTKSEPQNI